MGILDIAGWQPSKEFVLEHLKPPKRLRLKLDGFPRGLDGARIDVWLGEQLQQGIADQVELGLAKRMQMLQISDAPVLNALEASNRFQEAYGAAALAAALRARDEGRREIYQLFHLAVVKQILLTLDARIRSWWEGEEGALNVEARQAGGLARAERLRQFRRCQPRLRYLVAHDVLSIVHSLDRVARKRRKSLLAVSWPVAEELLFNPLLQLDDLGCEESFLELYPLVLLDPQRFREVERAVLTPLEKWLPAQCLQQPPELDEQALKSLPVRQDQGELSGYAQVEAYLRRVMTPEEYQQPVVCWLDRPRNLVRLLGGERKGGGTGPWRHARWPAFQKAMLEEVERALDREGLLEPLYASLCLRRIYPDLGRRGTPSLLLDYLLSRRSRQEVIAALERLEEIPNLSGYHSTLSRARKELRQASPATRRHWLLESLEGFARLRRDLKLAWEGYSAMDGFRLLERPEDIQLSRENGLLQDFTPGAAAPRRLQGHVILKADLRGSTELIAELARAGINPATYFTHNLFGPLNGLLRSFAAEKVFLEGDAAILIIEDGGGEALTPVARACALAQELIALVAERNRENRHQGLPELELGVGIAWEPGAPTFLFDEGRRITISPAIHRADRLSSSDLPRGFLERLRGKGTPAWGVEEVLFRESANPVSEQAQLRRYNVNGIELDRPAFEHLRQELVMKRVEESEGRAGHRYHVGRFMDESGKPRWLVVREAPLLAWNGRELSVMEGEGARHFYEVVASPELARKIRNRLAGKN